MVTLVNRAKVATATTGTGTLTLGSAESGYQSFADAGVVDTDVVRYVIEDGTDWEIGTGTYTATGTTLSRTVLESSNADAALNLTGSAVVYVSATAEDIPPALELYAENPSSPTAPSATGTNAVAIGENARATGDRGMAFGSESLASGTNSIALGRAATSSGLLSNAMGFGATAGAQSSFAMGYGAITATGLYSTSIGRSYASGADSFAAAIANNTSSYGATGANSVAIGKEAKATTSNALAIGQSVTSSASHSFVAGRNNTVSATGATAFGTFNIASGGSSFVVGSNSIATKDGTIATGFYASATIRHKKVHASGRFVYAGDAQTGTLVLRSDTTDASPEALTSINSTPSNENQIILPNNSAYAFHGTIVARQQASTGTACAAWKVEGLIRREGSAGTTVLVNSATTVLDNTPAWGMTLSADTTNGGLKIEVTGAAATNIRWVATINTSEVTY